MKPKFSRLNHWALCLGLAPAAGIGCVAQQEHASRAPRTLAASTAASPSRAPSSPVGAASAGPAPAKPIDPTDPGTAFDPPVQLRLPSTIKSGERVPLLMILHGFGVSSSLLVAKASLNLVADAKKFAYLAPEGSRDSVGRTFWNAGPSCCDLEHRAPDDLRRLRALLDFTLKNPAIDPQRVFLIGYSNGGFLAHRLACDLSDRLAGIISVAGAASGPDVPCAPTTPLSVLEIHGDADPVVHYQGGVVFDRTDLPAHPSAPDTAKIWAKRLGCTGEPLSVGSADLEPYVAGSETEMVRFQGCRGAVELWTVHGGGHYVALQPPALEAMWNFILAHPKGGL
jgi:polyhydroxybutyrate depolymerase